VVSGSLQTASTAGKSARDSYPPLVPAKIVKTLVGGAALLGHAVNSNHVGKHKSIWLNGSPCADLQCIVQRHS
jgi:hypothetical protein